MSGAEAELAVRRIWKEEAPRVIGGLARLLRDVALAEDFAQEAVVAALEQWPRSGVPEKPGAWLMTTARNRALNALRRAAMAERTGAALGLEDGRRASPGDLEAALAEGVDRDVPDDVLRLLFTACDPVLSQEARVTLTLRVVGGLTTEEIARAFLTTEPTIAQRVVRAKRALGEAGLPFEVPRGAELQARLPSVLEVLYLVFNEGHTATAGEDLLRPDLTDEALRLTQLVAELLPGEPEVHGLLALMRFHASRARSRTDERGDPVLLETQDRTRWDAGLIAGGFGALGRAESLTDAPGPYQLQAMIASCHARAATPGETDWKRIAELYGDLGNLNPSPVIELNRALAVSRAEGPAAGLLLLDALAAHPELARYHLLPAARAELLQALGRFEEARVEFERAASLTRNARQRARLEARAAACVPR
ncbi:MAG: RNA polymerase sigma factor [Myxococcaceae bacterium]|nr:MAG: RNA polymerase sigma factor [Myxococcaceae bacterium]